VQSKIDSAFRLLAGAVTELNKTPVDANVDNLFDTLFGRRIGQAPNSDVVRRMARLAAISTFNNNDQTTSDASNRGDGITDVRFYCTVKRIKKLGHDKYLNKDRNLEYDPQDKIDRFARCYDVNPPTLAITMTWSGQFSEIQICPWFLGKSRGFAMSDLSSLSKQPFLAALSRFTVPVVAKMAYTPLDSFVLMDKVIVHELTHTDQASIPLRFATDDSKPDPYGKNCILGIISAFLDNFADPFIPTTGFKNARSKADTYRINPIIPNDPMKNADSNALFAVGAWIISQTGVGIGQDGTFTKPQTNPKARRGLKGF
jgi:hypothetical protein